MREAGGAQHRRHAERAQHDGGVALGAALFGRDAGEARRVEQRGVGGAQRLADQTRRLRAARRSCGTALRVRLRTRRRPISRTSSARRMQAGAVVAVIPGSACARIASAIASASCDDRGLGRDQRLGDAPAHAAHQARRAHHVQVGIDQRRDFGLAVLRQHGKPARSFSTACATGRWRRRGGRLRRRCRPPGSCAG